MFIKLFQKSLGLAVSLTLVSGIFFSVSASAQQTTRPTPSDLGNFPIPSGQAPFLFYFPYGSAISDIDVTNQASTVVLTNISNPGQAPAFELVPAESVDVFNPKTVRATVGSLWHIPVVSDVDMNEFISGAIENKVSLFALTGDGKESFDSIFVAKTSTTPSAWIFGNEARGLPDLPGEIATVAIPMKGFAESLNVASAAAIVLHSVGLSL